MGVVSRKPKSMRNKSCVGPRSMVEDKRAEMPDVNNGYAFTLSSLSVSWQWIYNTGIIEVSHSQYQYTTAHAKYHTKSSRAHF
jgi:hypothetical protein